MDETDVRHQDGDCRRRHAADPRCLPDGARANRLELLDDLVREPGDVAIDDPVGDLHVVGLRELRGVGLLAAQVAVVGQLDLDALERRRTAAPCRDAASRRDLLDRAPVELGPLAQLRE